MSCHTRLVSFTSTALIGCMALAIGGTASAGFGQCEVTRLSDPTAPAHTEMGYCALDGNVLLVGAGADIVGTLPGVTYVYRFDGTDWVPEDVLAPADGGPGNRFGSASISCGRAVIGAYRDDEAGADAGAAYAFHHDGNGWIEAQKLIGSDVEAEDWFGIIVSTAADVSIVASTGDDDVAENAGAAYIFRHDGNGWVEETKLVASDGSAGDGFGYPVAMSSCGNVAIVGAYASNDWLGAAYVYRYDGQGWNEEAKLTPPDGVTGTAFGLAASIDRNVAIVSAIYADSGDVEDTGAVHVFERTGGTWSFIDTLEASDASADLYFGSDIAVRDNTIVISAADDSTHGPAAGATYVYRRGNGGWSEQSKLYAAEPAEGDWFGNSIAISGDHLAITSRMADGPSGENVGAVHVFAGLLGVDYNANGVADACEVLCGGDLNGDGAVDGADLGLLLSGWGGCGE